MSEEIPLSQPYFRHSNSNDDNIKQESLLDEDEFRDEYYSKYPFGLSLTNDASRIIWQAGDPTMTDEKWFLHEDDQKTVIHKNFRDAIANSVIFTTEKVNDAVNSKALKAKETFPGTLLLNESEKNEWLPSTSEKLIVLGVTQPLITQIPSGHDYLIMTGICSCDSAMCFSRYAWIEKSETGKTFRILMMLEYFSPHIFIYPNWKNLDGPHDLHVPDYKKLNLQTLFQSVK